ncbi:MAG TPA: EF-hand domain-containing protein, partial [Ottowia sp.]|nr:EF-hand domain-containing protein [Ottowia sp.]
NERLGLTKQLLQLEGNTVLLRQIELEALDPSNRALQQRIWAIEDETAAAEKYKSALKDAQDFLGGFTKNIEEFIFKVSHAQADAQQSYQMAAAKFTAQMTLARGGDRDAMNGITGYADTLIGSIRRESTTGAEANLRIARVLGQLASLPKQISAEQLIVDAIVNAKTSLETVLSTNFASLDANVDGLLTADELAASGLATNTQISALMARVDANGDGMISKQELANSRLQMLATEQCTTNTNLGNVTSAQNSTNSWLSQIQMADVGYSLSNVNAINAGASATVAAINKTNAQIGTFNRNYDNPVTAQFSADSPLYSIFRGIDETNTWLYKLHGLLTLNWLSWDFLLNKGSVINVRSENRTPANGTVFADGGYTGPGAKWEPAGVVHKGEVVWSQADVARWGGPGIVDALRQGAPGYADGGPVAVRVPQIYVPPVGRSNEETQALLREVLAELRAQRSDDRARHSSLAEPLQRMDRRGAKWDKDGLPAERTNEAIA